MRMRVGFWFAAAVAGAGVLASDVAAQPHRLAVQTGNIFHGDFTTSPGVTSVEHLYSGGVGGVSPSHYSYTGYSNSDSGVIRIGGSWDLGGGAGDPIQPANPPDSYASIYQVLDPTGLAAPMVTVTATLDWGGGALLVSESGDVDRAEINARLDLAGCYVQLRRQIYTNGSVEDSDASSLGSSCTASASGGLLRLTRTYTGASIGAFTTFPLEAIVSATTGPLEYDDYGQFAVSGNLAVDVEGVAYTAASPTFLTVPEAGGLGASAVAALAVLAARRRAQDARSA